MFMVISLCCFARAALLSDSLLLTLVIVHTIVLFLFRVEELLLWFCVNRHGSIDQLGAIVDPFALTTKSDFE